MNTISIVYATRTQHSRKLAEAIGQELGVIAKNIKDFPCPEQTGLLFIVGGIYAGKSNPELFNYVKKLESSQVKKVILVTSSVSKSCRSQKDIYKLLTEKKIEVVDEITCTGRLLFINFSHPNKVDICAIAKKAKELAKIHCCN